MSGKWNQTYIYIIVLFQAFKLCLRGHRQFVSGRRACSSIAHCYGILCLTHHRAMLMQKADFLASPFSTTLMRACLRRSSACTIFNARPVELSSAPVANVYQCTLSNPFKHLACLSFSAPFLSRAAHQPALCSNAKAMPQKRTMVQIGTHSGSFHCDEALACYLLHQTKQFSEAGITRR
jgi:hypothetical protein